MEEKLKRKLEGSCKEFQGKLGGKLKKSWREVERKSKRSEKEDRKLKER